MKLLTLIAITVLLYICPDSIEQALSRTAKKVTVMKVNFLNRFIKQPWVAYFIYLFIPGLILCGIFYLVNTYCSLFIYFFMNILIASLCFNSYDLNYAIFKNRIPGNFSASQLLKNLNISLLTPTLIYLCFGPIFLALHRMHMCLVQLGEDRPEEKICIAADRVNIILDWFFIRVGCIAFAFMSDFSKVFTMFKVNCLKSPGCLQDFYQSIVDKVTQSEDDGPPNVIIRGLIIRSYILILTCYAIYIAQFGVR